jgi:hypothetical protein
MEGWIDCKYCHNRFRAFIQFCPRCGNQNPYYNRHIPGVLKDNIWKRYIVIVVVCILVVITCIVVAFNGFSKSYHSISTNNPDLSNGLYIAKAKPVDLEQRLPKFTTQLIRYALNKINEDRSKFNLPPVQLSYNEAAQIQAADILKARSISHWTTDGMKPYMVYSIYNGSGGVSWYHKSI